MSVVLHQVFSGRAAMLHLGAFTATIMSANVFFIIMPNQRVVVADLKAGPQARPEIRQDRQAAQHAQQLSDAAGDLPDAVEPLPAGLRHAVQLDHRQPGVPDGRDDPALVQHPPRPQGQPALDLGATVLLFLAAPGCRPRRCALARGRGAA
jgi:hypothetical protein